MIKQIKQLTIGAKITLVILFLLFILTCFVASSYSYWQINVKTTKTNTVTTGCFSYEFTDKNSINMPNAYPITDEEGYKTVPYTFTVKNTCSTDMSYIATLNTIGLSDLDGAIKVGLKDGINTSTPVILNTLEKYDEYTNYTYNDGEHEFSIINSYVLTRGFLGSATMDVSNATIVKSGETITYNLYLWLDENVEASETMNKSFAAKVIVVSSPTIIEEDSSN